MRGRKTSQTIFEIPGRILAGAKHLKVSQIPLFPPLSRGDEKGISGFLCGLDVPSAEFILSEAEGFRTDLARENFL
jgi:hypothetical protein